MARHIFVGEGAPSFTPTRLGQHFIDTLNGVSYISTGVDSPSDWSITSFNSSLIDHTQILNIGVNTHDQIDSHLASNNNPHSVTKAQVGLANADNTSDLAKPISMATQAALDLKYDASNPSQFQTLAQVTATVNSASTLDRARENHTGSQLSSTISDFTEAAQDSSAAMITNAIYDGILVSYNDTANSLAIANTDKGSTARNAHEAEVNPHPQYLTQEEGNSFYAGINHTHLLSAISQSGAITGQVPQWNGSVWAPSNLPVVIQEEIKVTGSIHTSTSPAYQNVSELVSSPLQIGVYDFKFVGIAQSTSTGTGIGLRLNNETATMSSIVINWKISQAANGTDKDFDYSQLATNINVTSTSVLTANADFSVYAYGVFRITSVGSVAIQIRSEVSGSAVSIRPNSFFIIKRVGG